MTHQPPPSKGAPIVTKECSFCGTRNHDDGACMGYKEASKVAQEYRYNFAKDHQNASQILMQNRIPKAAIYFSAEFNEHTDAFVFESELSSVKEQLEKIRPYARHDGLCGIVGGYNRCTCGLETIIATIKAKGGQDE